MDKELEILLKNEKTKKKLIFLRELEKIDRSSSIIFFAIQSRIFLFLIQVLFNYLVSDHKPDVFNPPYNSNSTSKADSLANIFLDGLTKRWDALYFMHISEFSYTYENTLAFFPIFPYLVKFLSHTLFSPLSFLFSLRVVMHITAIILNNMSFVGSSWCLYKLSKLAMSSEHLAFRSAQLFCINPASVFFSAAYSESLFSLFSFSGLLFLNLEQPFLSSLLFSLASGTRSNGIINCIFIFIHLFKKIKQLFFSKNDTNSKFFLIICYATYLIILCFISCLFFITFQCFSYLLYCSNLRYQFHSRIPFFLKTYGFQMGYKLPGNQPAPSFCNFSIPLPYTSIQKSHWGVGLFQYYQWKQIPNFFLVSPILFISLCYIFSFSKNVSILFINSKYLRRIKNFFSFFFFFSFSPFKISDKLKTLQKDFFPHFLHLSYLTFFSICFVHIQVTTRLLCSSCAVLFMYLAEVTLSQEEKVAMALVTQSRNLEEEFFVVKQNKFNVKEKNKLISMKKEKDENLVLKQNKFQVFKENFLKERITKSKTKNICSDIRMKQKFLKDLNDLAILDVELIEETILNNEILSWSVGFFNKFLSIYFHLFLFLGVALFSNFFPWT